MFEDHADFVAITFFEFGHGICAALAEGTLEVAEFNDSDLRIGGAEAWCAADSDLGALSGLWCLRALGGGFLGDGFARKLRVNDLLEALDGLCANDLDTVDEEGGRTICANFARLFEIGINEGFVFSAVEFLGKACGVEAEFFRPFDEVIAVEAAEVLEEFIVVFPEFTLCMSGHRGLCSKVSVFVEAQRQVFENDADLVTILFFERGHGICAALAEGALEVAEFDDGHFGIGGAKGGRATDGDLNRAFGCLGTLGRCIHRNGFARKLGVDDLSEALGGLCANDFDAIDEEGGRTIGTDLTGLCKVGIDEGFVFSAVEFLGKACGVEAEFFRPFDEVIAVEAAEVLEEFIVVFPEFTLCVSSHRGLCSKVSILVEAQR